MDGEDQFKIELAEGSGVESPQLNNSNQLKLTSQALALEPKQECYRTDEVDDCQDSSSKNIG